MFSVLCFCFICTGTSYGKMMVGVILTGNVPYYRTMHKALTEELSKILPAGEEISFALQRPFPDPTAWSNAARKLIVGEVDLILSYGYPATDAVLSKKSRIPTVYIGVFDPQTNLEGDNVTGCSYKISLSSLLRYYKQIMNIQRLAVIYSRNEGDSVNQMQELLDLAGQQQITALKIDISAPEDVTQLDKLKTGDAVYFTGSTFAHVMIDDILAVLEEKKIPAADIFPDQSRSKGVLMTLDQDPVKMGRRGAELAAKVIKGEQPGKIEPVQEGDSELVVNLEVAKKMGISVPSQLVGEATRVIK